MPVFNEEFFGDVTPVLFVVVADIHHGDVVLAFDQHIAVRQFADALVVRAINHAADRALADVRVFQDPYGVLRHENS